MFFVKKIIFIFQILPIQNQEYQHITINNKQVRLCVDVHTLEEL